jgi:deoxyhypusine synthase
MDGYDQARNEDQESSSSHSAGNLQQNARDAILVKSENIEGTVIKGYDFNDGVDYSKIIKSFGSTGFMASHFSRAIEIVNKMISERATIYLGYTSNMISSGLREIFRYLVQHKKVDYVVTSGGGVEEDFIKCLGDCVVGDFRASGAKLREKGINRIGNIYAPNNNYIKFENFIMPVLEEMHDEQKKTGRVWTPADLIWKLGEKIDNEESVYYWAWKNKIRVFSPSALDGSLGDMVYFFKHKKGREDFVIDIAEETRELNDSTTGLKKSGVVILGAGVIKHAILNAHLYRNGADYAVYINNAQEFDGSDAGALPEEAISWGKLRPEVEAVKVYGDATILFPLMVAESFAKK